MKCKKLIKSYPSKNATLAKNEAASSSSGALTAIFFLSSSDHNISGSLIPDLIQYMLKVSDKYPSTFTNAYNMLTCVLSWQTQDIIVSGAHEINVTGKIAVPAVGGTIHLSNTPHHRVQSSFQVLTSTHHIALISSIVIIGYIVRISAQNLRET